MAEDVYIVGAFTSAVARRFDTNLKALTREAYEGVLADAGLRTGEGIAAAWFGNSFMHYWGQPMTRGNICFQPLLSEGLFPDFAPIVNVEGGCATGSLALHAAATEIRAGAADMTLAIGVEKIYNPNDPEGMKAAFAGGVDQMDPQILEDLYGGLAKELGAEFGPGPDRTIAMDTYALKMQYHMQRYGTTIEQIAYAAAKNHCHGVNNPKAQYRFPMTVEQVLQDRMVVPPLTRAMCAPIGDGAAAAILCSARQLSKLPQETRKRAVKLRASVVTGGAVRGPDETTLAREAVDRAYAIAGIGPGHVDFAEVHDAAAFAEIYQAEMLRFCGEGEGGPFVESGATKLGGSLPINVSGGLVSKGHPVGATGISMAYEIITQLRGEAGANQIEDASIGLQENGGGIIGFEEALVAVSVFERLN